MRERYWWLNEESIQVLNRGYLLKGETVKDAVERIATASANHLSHNVGRGELFQLYKDKFVELIERGWMSLSSPIWANLGTKRGLPISCVTGETWINTSTGGKQAKDIKIGDLILTHKNRFRPITDIIITKDRSNIYKLKVGTRMTNLYITENHLVLTNLGWVKVEDLDPDIHLIAVNGKLDYEATDKTIDLKEYVPYKFIVREGKICKSSEAKTEKTKKRNKDSEIITYYSQPNEFIDVDEDLAWALGVWFAEGSLARNKDKKPNGIRITTHADKKEILAEKWLEIMSAKFNLKGNIYKSEVVRNNKINSWISVNLNGGIIGNYFETFGKNAKEKRVPDWLLNLPTEHLQRFLEGILEDGSLKNNSYKLTLANPELLLQVYNIGLKLGYDMSLQMQEKSGKLSTTKHTYTVVFRKYKTSVSKHLSNSGIRFKDGLIYCPIKTLELTDKKEDVYDFTVEEDHSFSAAGVVLHNCFGVTLEDSIESITNKLGEVIGQTKIGGGTSGYFGSLRGRGAAITDNGQSSGSVSFMQMFDTAMNVVSQGSTRRGSFAAYLDIDHPDIEEFLKIRDIGNPIQNLFYAVNVPDFWMQDMIDGDKEKRRLWAKVLESRQEKGLPYIFFTDNVNKNRPDIYKKTGRKIHASNLCSEIALSSSKDESFVCCLSSMNLELYNEWKDTDAVKYAIYFLDGVMSEFIEKTKNNFHLKASHNFAYRQRALGLGALGFHSYLQSKMIPFEGLDAKRVNNEIFKNISLEANKATKELAKIYGPAPIYHEVQNYPVEDLRRNVTVLSIAP